MALETAKVTAKEVSAHVAENERVEWSMTQDDLIQQIKTFSLDSIAELFRLAARYADQHRSFFSQFATTAKVRHHLSIKEVREVQGSKVQHISSFFSGALMLQSEAAGSMAGAVAGGFRSHTEMNTTSAGSKRDLASQLVQHHEQDSSKAGQQAESLLQSAQTVSQSKAAFVNSLRS